MIRKMTVEDFDIFLNMSKEFYSSDAVLHPIPESHHINAFYEMMRSDVYLEGFIFLLDDKPAGYALIAKTYSQEAGGITLWIDEIFILDEFRSKGLGREFFSYLFSDSDSVARFRLEVESRNERAVKLYKNMGFDELKYKQMYKDMKVI